LPRDCACSAAAHARTRRSGSAPLSEPEKPEPLHAVPGILGLTRRPTRREWRRAIITFVVGVGVIFLAIVLVHTQPPLLANGTVAPPIVLESDAGQKIDVLRGAAHHAVVLEFFETACVTCEQRA